MEKIINSKNQYLLITTVGRRALEICQKWISNKRDYDVLFIYYDKIESPRISKLPDFYIKRSGFKYPILYYIFKKYPFLTKKYKYFFLPDDDVEIDSNAISSLFDFSTENKIAICQPSVLPLNSTIDITVNNSLTHFRLVSSVEIMCPLFSKSALKTCLNTFNETQSGWGLGPVWSKLLDKQDNKVAICDTVIAFHSVPMDTSKGGFYKALNECGINPRSELEAIYLKYNIRVGFVENSFFYKNTRHSEIYFFLNNLNRHIDCHESRFNLILVIYGILIKSAIKVFPLQTEHLESLFNFNLDKGNTSFSINELQNFYELNKFKIKDVLVEVIYGTDVFSFRDIDLDRWHSLCTCYLTNSNESIPSVTLSIISLIEKHLFVSYDLKTIIYYSIYKSIF